MSEALDPKDSELLNAMQSGLEVTSRPFLSIANAVGLEEEEVLKRLEALIDTGIIRKVGAVIAPKNMGFVSTLAALDVPLNEVDKVAAIINEYRGVTHNYLREGKPNIWFTITEPDAKTLDSKICDIEERTGFPVLRMPVTKLFKIGVKVDV